MIHITISFGAKRLGVFPLCQRRRKRGSFTRNGGRLGVLRSSLAEGLLRAPIRSGGGLGDVG